MRKRINPSEIRKIRHFLSKSDINKILIIGGFDNDTEYDDIWVYNI